MTNFESIYEGKKVFITGHTGFTGGWIWSWLKTLGATCCGYSLAPITTQSLYDALNLKSDPNSHIGNILDEARLVGALNAFKPDIVLHLAAQPLVRRSYLDPMETFAVNVTGTVNVLEAARQCKSVKAFVCVTTDKVYRDTGSAKPHAEDAALGGADPYSASKAAAEMAAQSYQTTLSQLGNGMAIATVRAGNIIGGGDWSQDRLVPDFVRAWQAKAPLVIRNPESVRPWQHVLAACHGYLAVGAYLLERRQPNGGGWNIGPFDGGLTTVRDVLTGLAATLGSVEIRHEPSPLKETGVLRLNASKLHNELKVKMPWTTNETVIRTAEWYRSYAENPGNASSLTARHLADYRRALS